MAQHSGPGTETLAGELDALVAERGKRTALIQADSPHSRRSLTFAELADASGEVAAVLASAGVQRGDVVGVWLPNVIESFVLEFALARLGAAYLGINTRYGVEEVTHLLRVGRPVGVVAPGSFHGIDFPGRLRQALSSCAEDGVEGPRWVAWLGEEPVSTLPGVTSWRLQSDQASGEVAAAGNSADPVNFFTTSGSTGLPKLAGHDQRSVVLHGHNAAGAFGMRPGDVALGALPFSGVFGFNHLMAMLLSGGTCLLIPVFDAAAAIDHMVSLGVSHVIGGDDLFLRLIDAWESAGRPDLPTFRRGGIADFTGSADRCAAWAESFGADITGVYGSSEVFALTATWPPGLPLEERVRGGGRLVSDRIQVRVADPVTGAPLDRGVAGEIQVKGYNVVTTYLSESDVARQAYTPDDWFHTGDLGIQGERPDEFVYLCRAGDALRLRGFLVEPAEIERFLVSQPGVQTAKVVAAKAAEGGDTAVAFVTAAPGAQLLEEGLIEAARARLAAFKVPAAIKIIEEFPVTSGTNGTKIRSGVLREWAKAVVAGEWPVPRGEE